MTTLATTSVVTSPALRTPRRPCAACQAGAARCVRCTRALCFDHVSLDGHCNDCELAYHADRARLRLGGWFALGAAPPIALLAATWSELASMRMAGGFRAITTGVPLLDGIVVAGVTAVILGRGMVGVRTWLHRRRFFLPAAT